MASISTDKQGRRRVLFVHPNGDRKAIWLGKVAARTAEATASRVEQLVERLSYGKAMSNELAEWIASLQPKMAAKLVKAGLIDPPDADSEAITLGEHLDNYLARRTDVKPNTLTHWRQTIRSLKEYFGADKPLESITAGDARDFKRWLKSGKARKAGYVDASPNDGLSTNTIRKRLRNSKQFFQDAVDRELIAKNPFARMSGTVGANRERDFYIDRETADKVLDACPDAQWKLIFGLSRYAGLRCPSEHLALTWGDINWAENRMVIHSAKTEHHEGKGSRVIPIFPELVPLLNAVWDEGNPDDHVITRYRASNANLRTQLQRIIERAGCTPWPKLFANLRASRATELANEYPAHVAAAWMGHSIVVANQHYWQVTDADFERAAKGGGKLTRKSAQQAHAEFGKGQNDEQPGEGSSPALPGVSTNCILLHNSLIGPAGLEPATKGL